MLVDVQHKLIDAILDSASTNPLDQSMRDGPKGWAVRYLPPGKLSDMYVLYQGWGRTRNLKIACADTFRKVWRSGWGKVLAFRPRSTHSECSTCAELRAKTRTSESLEDHIKASNLLVCHLRDQWADRAIYWCLRARARSEKDVLLVIGDGMDKSKFGIPSWEGGRAPKSTVTDHIPRPTCEVYACIAHGFRIDVYVASEGTSVGGSFATDCVLRTMDAVHRQCVENNIPYPAYAVVQGDNTTSELKNSILARTLGCLVSAGIFKACGHFHLRVGHTHEDVDQFFGMVARSRLHKHCDKVDLNLHYGHGGTPEHLAGTLSPQRNHETPCEHP